MNITRQLRDLIAATSRVLSCSKTIQIADLSALVALKFDGWPQNNDESPPCSQKLSSQWRHNDQDGVSNQKPHGCLLNRLFRGKSKKASKLRVTGLCVGTSPGTGEFSAQRASKCFHLMTSSWCVSFYSHLWNRIGVIAWKRSNRAKSSIFRTVWPWNWANELKLESQSVNTQSGSKLGTFLSSVTSKFGRWPWKTKGPTPLVCHCKLCASFRSHLRIPRRCGPEMHKLGQNFFWPLWLWRLTSDLSFCLDITFVNCSYSWKFHEGTITEILQKSVPDRRRDERANGRCWWNILIYYLFIYLSIIFVMKT